MQAEMMKSIEQKGDSSIMDVQKKAEKIPEDKQRKMGEKIKERIDVLNSTELLKDFSTRPQKNVLNMDNPGHATIGEALKDPENKEKIQTMQYLLGYKNPEGKIYYNPCRNDIKDGGSIRNKTPDGKAGAFTIGAMNNMIADSKEEGILEVRNISTLEGVNDFIGSLHPYFYTRLTNPEMVNKFPENSKERTIIETMAKITKNEATQEDIKHMQTALHNLKAYPSIHNNEKKDGIPGPFTQIALQNFVFENNLI